MNNTITHNGESFCLVCCEGTLRKITEDYTYSHNGKSFLIRNATLLICNCCSAKFFDKELNKDVLKYVA